MSQITQIQEKTKRWCSTPDTLFNGAGLRSRWIGAIAAQDIVQHSAHIAPGREGLRSIKSLHQC